jgi:hypothetical protein
VKPELQLEGYLCQWLQQQQQHSRTTTTCSSNSVLTRNHLERAD